MEQEKKEIYVIANGKRYAIASGSTVADLLTSFHINAQQVVVQLNGVILARADFASVSLLDDAQLEIVTLVGGG